MNTENNNENIQWRESSFKALIPFIVFVLFYFGFSMLTRDFSRVPMTVAFIISSATALILNHKEKLSKKLDSINPKKIIYKYLIFIKECNYYN